jgi:predicted transcriptional regulator
MDTVQLNARVSPDLRRQVKVLSAVANVPEREIVEQALRGYLASQGHRLAVDAAADEIERQYAPALDALTDL